MKKNFTLSLLGAILYLLSGWNGATAQEPLQFYAYSGNPVLTHGAPGSYDASMCFLPYALWHDGIFYLYYTGDDNICVATSSDGYTFEKYFDNPLLTPSASGFDSYAISQTVVIETGSEWVMYYCGREDAGYGPGQAIGRATSEYLTGPWERQTDPVLTVGDPGEWDEGFIAPNGVFPMDTGGFIMFYSASTDFFTGYWEIGMATSPDGITWVKYNDPFTPFPPYADSDPVVKVGDAGQWDEFAAWECTVIDQHGYYEMYYSGGGVSTSGIGYAWSYDGITWEKWPENPIYVPDDDPYAVSIGGNVEVPSLLVYNGDVFMYYDYGPGPAEIGMAIADTWVGTNERITNDDFRMTIYPNPISSFATFTYTLDEPSQVSIEILDCYGRVVAEPVNSYQQKGEQQTFWNADGFPAGIYFYRIQAGNQVGSGKIIKW